VIVRHAHTRVRTPRGFTLLELLLATLIAAMLMAGLYVALNMTLQQTQTSRDAVETEDLTRGVFNKFRLDLDGTLGPLPPKSGGNAAGSGGLVLNQGTDPSMDPNAAMNGGTNQTPTTPNTPTTPSTPTTADPNATTADPSATDNATALAADTNFQAGVIGDAKKMVIYASRVPEAFGHLGSNGIQERSDQRQIIYWYEPGRGLCRQERPWVTADGVRNSTEPDLSLVDSSILAEEVVDVTFEYIDSSGSAASSWDGTELGPDGVTVKGPPRAIRVTLMLEIPSGKSEPIRKQISQVIPVRAAPGPKTPEFLEAPTDAASESTPSSNPSNTGMGGSGGMGGNTSQGGGGGGTPPKSGATSGATGSRPSGGSTGGGGGVTGGLSLPGGSGLPPGVSMPSGGSTGGRPSGGTTGGGNPSGAGGTRPSGGGKR